MIWNGSNRRTFAVVLAGFSAFLTLYAPQPLLPMLGHAFHKSPAEVSLLVSISTLAVALAAPLAGSIADRWGRKRVIVPATLLLAVPTLAAATSGSFGQLLFWRFWQGILTPGIFAVTVAYINEEWHEGAGAAVAAYVTGTVLGGFCGRTLAAVVAGHLAWQWAFALLGILTAGCGAGVWRWLPQDRVRPRRAGGAARSILRHLRNPQLLATYAAGFCVLFSLLGTFTYVNFYLAAPPFYLGTTALGMLFVVYLVGAVVTPWAGRWIDRVGHRAAFSGALALALSGCLLTLVRSLPLIVAGLAISCTGVFIAQSAANAYIGIVATEAKAAAVGLYVTFYYLGGSFGAALPGHVWPLGGWPACVALIATVQLATIAVARCFWRAPQAAAPVVMELKAALEERGLPVSEIGA
ncbi:MAG TPA: MFS transporter [Bryobacteraceae bacterium]|nr:MFS transporter [Bryobacteraceae bacterium]